MVCVILKFSATLWIKSWQLHGLRIPIEYPKKAPIVSNVAKVKSQVTREHPPTQKSIEKSLRTSGTTINKIINQGLRHIKSKKK